MTDLSANATPQLVELIREGRVRVDYLKVGSWMAPQTLASFDSGLPLVLHGTEVLSREETFPQEVLAGVKAWVARTGTPWLSEHLGFSCEEVEIASEMIPALGTRLLSLDEARENICRNAKQLQAAIPVPLLLENLPRCLNHAHDHVCEPDFIAHVLQETGCGLLLDVAHARVSAFILGYDVYDYLARLPLEKTVEIHVSGPREEGGILTDRHEAMTQPDYEVLAYVLRHSSPKMVSLEYWRDKEALATQLVLLRGMLDGH